MKKSILISIILFLFSTILQMLLNFIVNEQVISRILYGTDYSTYFMNYYSGQHGLVGLISGDKMPYSWIFSISNIIIALLCVVIIFVIIKRLKIKYTITKKEFVIIMSIFSILSLCNVILYIIKFHNIPPIKYFYLPLLFIVSVYIGIYENMYLKNIKNINN